MIGSVDVCAVMTAAADRVATLSDGRMTATEVRLREASLVTAVTLSELRALHYELRSVPHLTSFAGRLERAINRIGGE